MSVRILEGDATATLRTLLPGTFQTCVTSPPYYGLRDYGVEGQMGLEESPDAYVDGMVTLFREVRRVLRDDGTLWLNLGDSYNSGSQNNAGKGGEMARGLAPVDGWAGHRPKIKGLKHKDLLGIPWLVAFALRADGWWLRSAVTWAKPNPMPESCTDRPTSSSEMVFLLAKSDRYFYDADAIREAEAVPGWDDGTRTFGGANKAGANAQQQRTTGRVAGPRVRGLPPRHAGDPNSDQSGLDDVDRGGGRNARNVWTIATRPYRGSHFATMPPELARRCIAAGSSERGRCPHCGAAWRRQTERTRRLHHTTTADGKTMDGPYAAQADIRSGVLCDVVTTGWAQACGCPAHEPIPCAVLDPFGGAGTTGLVADRMRRDATLVELNPEYAAMARKRIAGEQPLFADVL